MEVKLVIDGVEVKLEPNGKTKGGFHKFKEPADQEERSLIASVYVKPGK